MVDTVDTDQGGWRSRIVGHAEVAPGDLTENPRNWRTHPQAQRDALTGVLDTVGWVQDVIVNKRSGFILDGHARVAVATQRGAETVPVVYVDLDEDEELLMLATLDPLSAMAEADDDALADLLASVTSEDEALTAMLDDLAGAESDDLEGSRGPEMEITPTFMERADYIVLLFDNELDWVAAVDTLGITVVEAPNSRGKNRTHGVGRVIRGADVIQRLNGAQ
tara:strand:+ start:720 stop:1385 length:666 start_codon:yes stop_codon:yes gene_type:complete